MPRDNIADIEETSVESTTENQNKNVLIIKNEHNDPPSLKDCSTYEMWIKLLDLWERSTDLPLEKQGPR